MLCRTTQAVGPLRCNCTILADSVSREAVVVDPGGDADLILAQLRAERWDVRAIVHTHAHLDHVGATAAVAQWTGAPALLHPDDFFLYDMLDAQAAMLGLPRVDKVAMQPVADGERIPFGGLTLRVLHTPGHSPGSISLDLGPAHGLCLTGDTLFAGTVGRCDLPGGDAQALERSIVTKLLPLHGDTEIIPGHGHVSTIARERHSLAQRWG